MESRRCEACGQAFWPRPQTPRQSFCGAIDCQRERRRRWQRAKLAADPDYRSNQEQAHRAWAAAHADYWRAWRDRHPEYCERNRHRQRERNRRRQASAAAIAKMDASAPLLPVPSGIYRLVPATADGIAKRDACTVHISVIAGPYVRAGRPAAGLQKRT
jgi:hypothetical protein